MTNLEIADLLNAVAAAYQIKDKGKSSKGRSTSGRNKFKIIAYQRAADAVEHLSSEAKDLWDDKKLTEVAGIGESIASHLGEIFSKGKSPHFDRVMGGIPKAVFELIKISGVGPKTAVKLAGELDISSKKPMEDLLKKANKGKVSQIEGFGEDTQNAIIVSIKEFKGRKKRLLLPYAEKITDEVIVWLGQNKFVKKTDSLGSLRRMASTIGDIDIAVATDKPKEVIEYFCKYPKAKRVLERGEKKASIILPGNVQVDLTTQEPESYGSLLQHFTGSKHHNIALREFALKKGLSLSEYGIKSMVNGQWSMVKKFSKEQDFYNFLGMEWIPPELREDMGEIEMALQNKLPKLIGILAIKADLQIHSDFDIETSHDLGESSMEDIVKKADELGYEFIAMTEHNPSHSKHSDKQIIDLIKRKRNKIEEINSSLLKENPTSPRLRGVRVRKVFNSLEIDILPSGKLPIPQKALELLDFALVSIHSSFEQDREKMTRRVLDGLSHPKVKIFAHPTGRKLNKREGVELDWPRIFDFCKTNNKWVEINADPMRLDLPDVLVKEAIKAGVLLTLGTDAHHIDMMDNMRYGVYVARRGWAEKMDIVNTRSLKEFEEMLE